MEHTNAEEETMRLKIAGVIALTLFATHLRAEEATVRVGVEGNYPPFSQVSPDGTLSGFDIDIANAICTEMKTKCAMVQQEWDGMIPALNASKFDMIVASMSINEKRKKAVNFSKPYYDVPSRWIAKDGAFKSWKPEDLKGKTIIVLRNSPRAEYLAKNYPDSNVLAVDKEPAVYLELAAGRGDIAFGSSVVSAESFLKKPEGKGFSQVGDTLFLDEGTDGGVGIALRKTDDNLRAKVDEALTNVMKNGTYKQIAAKYFDFDVTPLSARK
ncbi:transporter substrate-binding domain-containing protein [Rhizobium sp. BK176]|uniref:transporter substrate-binding domain-containing protein n=2 Tax=unclassified Rhizobium TaxID=2613769 RepID=UPI0021674B2D|nr:transporter substrate-binding domain-containing protein [Rhizobium sp. BK176]MCS4093958.1 lysine-arginine-ornithine-binding protein [Rhizobium sp. BK176]